MINIDKKHFSNTEIAEVHRTLSNNIILVVADISGMLVDDIINKKYTYCSESKQIKLFGYVLRKSTKTFEYVLFVRNIHDKFLHGREERVWYQEFDKNKYALFNGICGMMRSQFIDYMRSVHNIEVVKLHVTYDKNAYDHSNELILRTHMVF